MKPAACPLALLQCLGHPFTQVLEPTSTTWKTQCRTARSGPRPECSGTRSRLINTSLWAGLFHGFFTSVFPRSQSRSDSTFPHKRLFSLLCLLLHCHNICYIAICNSAVQFISLTTEPTKNKCSHKTSTVYLFCMLTPDTPWDGSRWFLWEKSLC